MEEVYSMPQTDDELKAQVMAQTEAAIDAVRHVDLEALVRR